MTIFRGLTLVYMDGRPITGLGDHLMFQMFGRGYFLGIPVPAVTMMIAFAVLYFILKKTTFGVVHLQLVEMKKQQHYQVLMLRELK